MNQLKSTTPREHAAQITLGILGALLCGVGVIAILAHNWDDFSRSVRLLMAFVPLLAAQGWSFRVMRQDSSPAWIREASALLQTFAAGACLAIVSQVYNMGGDWPQFLFWWLLLTLPLVWAMRSTAVAMFYLCGIAVWSVNRPDFAPWHDSALLYPFLFLGVIPLCPGWKWDRQISLPLRWVGASSAIMGFAAAALAALRLVRHGGEFGSFGNTTSVVLLTSAALMLLPLTATAIDERLTRKPQIVLGGLVIVGFGLFAAADSTILRSGFQRLVETPVGWFLILLVAALLILAVARKRYLLAAIALPALMPIVEQSHTTNWLITLDLFLAGVAAIWLEMRGKNGAPRLGTLLVCALVAARWFNEDRLLTKGIAFLVAGSAIVAAIVFHTRTHRSTP